MENNDESPNQRGPSREHEEIERGGISVGDTLKKLLTAGVSAAFMTEESIRGFVSELRLPKETLNLLLQGAAKSKEEITNRVSREVINIISKIDFVKEASRFVEEHKFRISAEIEVLKRDKRQDRTDRQDEDSDGDGDEGKAASGGKRDASELKTRISFGGKNKR
jgi:hypothetical protein